MSFILRWFAESCDLCRAGVEVVDEEPDIRTEHPVHHRIAGRVTFEDVTLDTAAMSPFWKTSVWKSNPER